MASTTDVNSAVLAETPLIAACRFAPRPEQPENTAKNLAIVHALLEAGADVNQGGDPFLYPNQYTPLQHAAQIGNFQVVQLLLHARADVNNMHNRGPSPLMCAVDNDWTSTVLMLLSAPGIDLNGTTNDPMTPLCRAAQRNNITIAQILLSSRR